MDAQRWLELLRAAVAAQRLPPLYAERFVQELSDHLTDFLEDHMSTDAQDLRALAGPLGSPAALAAQAAHEFRRHRFSTRHPVVTFVLLPLVTLPVLWAGAVVSFMAAAKLLSKLMAVDGAFPTWATYSLPFVVYAMILLPIVLAAVLYCRVASRGAAAWRWPLTACAVLALVGGLASADVALPGSGGRGVVHGTRFAPREVGASGRGALNFGLGIGRYPRPWQVFQFSLPLAVCGLFAWRQYQQRRSHVLAG